MSSWRAQRAIFSKILAFGDPKFQNFARQAGCGLQSEMYGLAEPASIGIVLGIDGSCKYGNNIFHLFVGPY